MHIKVTPRKLPKSVSEEKTISEFNKYRQRSLIMAALLDGITIFTDTAPVFGQPGNILSAMSYGIAIFLIYKKRKMMAVVASVIGSVTEWNMGIDIVPVAVLVWVYAYLISGSKALDLYYEEKRRRFDYVNNHYL